MLKIFSCLPGLFQKYSFNFQLGIPFLAICEVSIYNDQSTLCIDFRKRRGCNRRPALSLYFVQSLASFTWYISSFNDCRCHLPSLLSGSDLWILMSLLSSRWEEPWWTHEHQTGLSQRRREGISFSMQGTKRDRSYILRNTFWGSQYPPPSPSAIT